MSYINVIYQSDNNYAPFMGVSIYSLLKNNVAVDNIEIYIIDDDISEENKEKLINLANAYKRGIHFLNVSMISALDEVKEFAKYTGARKNTHSFYKLFLTHLLSQDVHRILYIDCDTLVTGSIEDVMNIDMGSNVIGMILDSLIYKGKEAIGLKEKDPYFNSGVILFDVDKWKENLCEKKIVNTIKQHGQYGTVDQDVLNVALLGSIFTMPMEYNVQPHHLDFSIKTYFNAFPDRSDYYTPEEIAEAVKSPKILHFFRYLGKSPWDLRNYHPDRDIFDRYLSESPWCGFAKKDRPISFANKVEVALYRVLPKSLYFRIFILFHERMIILSNRAKK